MIPIEKHIIKRKSKTKKQLCYRFIIKYDIHKNILHIAIYEEIYKFDCILNTIRNNGIGGFFITVKNIDDFTKDDEYKIFKMIYEYELKTLTDLYTNLNNINHQINIQKEILKNFSEFEREEKLNRILNN